MDFKKTLIVGLGVICAMTVALAAHVQPYVVNYEEDATTARPLLGQKHCTYGPSYWCHNITQAKECGAVPHCIKKVWESMSVPDDNDDVCAICKEMVKEARDQLLSNETQDELRQVLEGSCNLIPLKIVSKECCKLADDFIPELVDALSSRMDPVTVCTVSGLCNSARIDAMLGEMKELDEDGNTFVRVKKAKFDLKEDSCPKCTHYMGKAIQMLKDLNKEELRTQLFEICGYFGSYSDSCRATVSRDLDDIFTHIQNADATELCGLIGLCSVVSIKPVKLQTESTKVSVWAPPRNDDDVECDFCKQLVDHVRIWLTANTTRDEFHKIIVGLCQQTGKYKQECVGLADQYAGPLYDFLITEMDPEEVCKTIGVCPSAIKGRVKLFNSATNVAPIWTLLSIKPEKKMEGLVPGERLTGDDEKKSHQPDFTYPMMELVPGESIVGEDEENAILLETNSIKKPVSDILPTCPLCTFTVNKLIELIGKNFTKESIDHATEEVCYMIPNKYKESCLTFMKEYGDRVMEMILIEGTAHEICAALHLCLWSTAPVRTPKPSMTVVVNSALPFERYVPQVPAVEKPNVQQKQTCVLCEFIMSQLDGMLKDNSTEEEIKDTVEHVCDYLPKTVRPQCRAFIEEYGDMVITYLAQSLDPQQICTEIKLCDPTANIDIRTIKVDETLELDRCELCVLISDYLSAFLDDPNFDSSVDKLVEKICPLLPNDYNEDCKNMIEDYGPYLLSLLAQETDKGKICTTINLCPASPA